MKVSKEILLKAGLYPKLQLGQRGIGTSGKESVQPTGPHRVKLLEDKIIKKLDTDGVEQHYVRYIVEEGGEKKQYDTRLKAKGGSDPSYLVQALAGIPEGVEVVLEMKKAGVKSYIAVTRVDTGETEEVEEDEDDGKEITKSASGDEELDSHLE